ncbi:MAG: PQQ-like beta-propeller repeat protein [Prolixibacteraceae bacterium]|jgi:outer membrane protein assembly factor BamB|nr:PQQ-like beta-propeller repeat protein [Prolixibacteraceae bacterium]MBT6763569.1 PQQ-like beta-propeller repeat protein [Prolixibacteraceae bacterium]MBT6999066.1 PQQ-like beta-propeller repeat protein [Prolixibacteraceae bacterium]MBT7394847.1 PQQ-like beta-propeller repeat protein [Prolixibacteraceae bacterium]
MKNKLILVSVFFLMTFVTHVVAQDWPQYLGPDRNSTSNQKNILRSWPESGPEVLWSVNVGIGYGGPVVKDGKVYILDRNDEVGDLMRCFDLNTGNELWKFEYDAAGSVMFPGSRSVPAIDGNHVYSCGPYGDLYCIDINSNKAVWNVNVWTDFGGDPGNAETDDSDGGRGGFGGRGNFPIWAISQCPLVYGDLLVIASQAPDAGVVAYNKTSGEIVWKTPNLGNETYVSPSIVKIDGADHIVMVISSTNPIGRSELPQTLGKVVGIEPLTGIILWEYDQWNCHISVPSAVDAGNNKVLVVGGYELGATMIQVEKQPDGKFITQELFTTEEFGDQTKPPLLIDGYFYAQYGTNSRRDGLTCMNMDGEVMWKTKRDPAFNKGSMILADGLILATDGAKKLYLIEPDTSGFKPLASVELLGEPKKQAEGIAARVGGSTQNWAPMALADGKLLIRDQNRMMCLKVTE